GGAGGPAGRAGVGGAQAGVKGGRRDRARPAGEPPRGVAASQSLEGGRLGGGPAGGHPPRLLHRPRRARRAAQVARPVLGRGTGGLCGRSRDQPREGQGQRNRTVTIAPVRKSIRVNANQAHAFEVFSAGRGRWWPRTHTIGKPPMQTAVLEPRLGGRWYELSADGSQAGVGKVLVWEPPERFVISWDLNSNWKPDTTVSS